MAAEAEGEVTMETAYESLGDVGMADDVEAILSAADAGEFADARSGLDDLLYDEGFEGEEILRELLETARGRYDGQELARLYRLAGDVDLEMSEGTSDRVHLGRLLAELGR
jgi:replication factor C small subunit